MPSGGGLPPLYNDRAIATGIFGALHADVALSAGVQRMVRSDIGASGVMFTIDTESGFRTWYSSPHPMALARRWCRVVNPDEFYVPSRRWDRANRR